MERIQLNEIKGVKKNTKKIKTAFITLQTKTKLKSSSVVHVMKH